MAKYLFIILFSIQALLLWSEENKEESNHFSMPVAYGDPSGIVGGHVNVISGDFIDSTRDLQILGPCPLTLDRSYATKVFKHTNSNMHGMGLNIKSLAVLSEEKTNRHHYPEIVVSAPYGALNRFTCKISSNETQYEANIAPVELIDGYTNTSSGVISGQRDLKNTIVKKKLRSDNFQMVSGDGTKHEYTFSKDLDCYALNKIIYPNGHFIQFDNYLRFRKKYLDAKEPAKIRCLSPDGNVEYGTITCSYSSTKEGIREHTYQGSNGQKTKYIFTVYPGSTQKLEDTLWMQPLADKHCLKQIVSSHQPLLEYEWEYAGKDSSGFKNERYRIKTRKLPANRHLHIFYNSDNTVAELKAPIGDDDKMRTAFKFEYEKNKEYENIKTSVYDAANHLTVYHYPNNQRIQSIEKYDGGQNHQLYTRERFVWGTNENYGQLLAHSIEEFHGWIQKCVTYDYDAKGNVTKETFFGNLTGKKEIAVPIDQKTKLPISNSCEHVSVLRNYSQCGRNLLLDETIGDKRTEYIYYPNTNLIKEKYTLVKDEILIREFYYYNSDKVMIKSIIDNGTKRSQRNLEGVTERKITRITPSKTPVIGLPEVVEEKYYDCGSKTEKFLEKTINTYNVFGLLTRQVKIDAEGKDAGVHTWEYDAHGNKIKEVNPLGEVIEYEYDENDNMILRKGPRRDTHSTFEYDFMNRLVAESLHADGKVWTKRYRYDTLSNLWWESDIHGNITHYKFDHFNRKIKRTTPTGSSETWEYNYLHHPHAHNSFNGARTTKVFNIRGQEAIIRYPDGTNEEMTYDLYGRLVEKRERNGTIIRFNYDGLDRETAREYLSKSGKLLAKTTKTYNAFHLISETDANGHTTYFDYDGAGRLVCKSSGNAKTINGYDILGRQAYTYEYYNDDAFRLTIHEYDALDRLIEKSVVEKDYTLVSRESYQYDVNGNRTHVFTEGDAGISLTFTEYDALGRVISITDPLGNKTTILYDDYYVNKNQHQVLKKTVIDPNGNQTIEIHDENGRVTELSKTDAFGTKTLQRQFEYDTEGNIVKQVDEVIKVIKTNASSTTRITEHITEWEFDQFNREIVCREAVGTPDQKITCTTYTALGDKSSVIKPDVVTIFYEYDPLRRLINRRSSDGSLEDTFRYDACGNLLSSTNKLTKKSTYRRYDANHRLVKETLANGLKLSYEYDRMGRILKTILPDGSAINYNYDACSIKSVSRNGYSHTYDRNDKSLRLCSETYCGTAGSQTYTYDLCGRLKSALSSYRQYSVPSNGYDSAGRLLRWNLCDAQGEVENTYAYDALDQLTEENGMVNHQYQCDSLCNRLQKDGAKQKHNDLNQLLSQQDRRYHYDQA